MHPAALDATGYTLLLSSFITLVILLWKGCKRKKKSPFYVLSASDVFSATLTAIILLVNHIEAGIRLNYNWQNNTSSDMPNHTWTIEDEDNYRFPFLQAYNLREAANEVDLNVTLMCGMKDILTQYGMLLAALTNAFISLLTFTAQCNLNAACIKRRCANIMKSSVKNTQLEPKDGGVKRRESEALENEQELASQPRDDINVKTRSNVLQKIMKISKFQMQKDDKKPISFLVTSHWLVPFLVVGILYLAEYGDMSNSRHTEDTECVFESNFPMNDFDRLLDDNLKIIDSVIYMTPLEHDYFVNEKLSNKSKPSSTEIDEVVSKVQSIVRTALSHTRNSTEDTNSTGIRFLGTLGPQHLTEYILTNNIMRYIKNITNIDSVAERVNSTLIERDINVHNSSTNNNIYLDQYLQVPLLRDSLKNASEELDITTSTLSNVSRASAENKDDNYQEDAPTHFASTEESTTERTTNISFVQNTTFVSNDQIYSEIMKRIQAASVYSAGKNHYNRSVNRHKDRDQPKGSNLKNDIAMRKSNSIKDLLSSKNDNLNRYINAEIKQSGSLNITNECFVSTKFLKLHLFVLSFTMYFLPILLSCILQMRGKHMCKNTLAILRAKTNLTSADSKCIHRRHSVEGSSTSQELKNDRSRTDIDVIKKEHRESSKENESITLEIECMVRIFNTIKLSLILCIIFWTPIFLGTLLRVFSCTRAPQWLTDTTFLSAVSFGIIRNALNINIIRIQEACSDSNMKENRIHPVE